MKKNICLFIVLCGLIFSVYGCTNMPEGESTYNKSIRLMSKTEKSFYRDTLHIRLSDTEDGEAILYNIRKNVLTRKNIPELFETHYGDFAVELIELNDKYESKLSKCDSKWWSHILELARKNKLSKSDKQNLENDPLLTLDEMDYLISNVEENECDSSKKVLHEILLEQQEAGFRGYRQSHKQRIMRAVMMCKNIKLENLVK